MKRISRLSLLASAACLIATLTGCGPSGPTLAPTSVTVTHNGTPVEGATVTFVSVEDPSAVATGVTDGSGKATLQTAGRDGAPVGKNNVGITKSAGGTGGPMSEEEAKKATMATIDGAKMKDMKSKSELPAKYGVPGTSGLSETVASGSNNFTFDLTDGAGAPAGGAGAPAGGAGDAEKK